jgi:hypothetical protein
MTDYDQTVRSALSAEDARLYDALGRSQNPVQAAFATLSSEHRLFAIGGWVFGVVMFAVAIYAASQFFEAETPRGMIGWTAGAIIALFALGFIKIWFFMEIQKNAVLRALKRVELQISAIQSRQR